METTNSHRALSLFALLASALALNISTAQAETVNCTAIKTIPAVIKASGVYCLKSNQSTNITTGAAILINADSVVLDLNGFTLSGPHAGPSMRNVGIDTGIGGQKNITVKNGTVQGFSRGVQLDEGFFSFIVEDIRAINNNQFGIIISGLGSIARNNQILGFERFAHIPTPVGIFVDQVDSRVINNEITGVGTAIIINAINALVVGNRITAARTGIDFILASGRGKYRDNLTFEVVTPYVGGIDAGNNN